jgi:hypothetical protein
MTDNVAPINPFVLDGMAIASNAPADYPGPREFFTAPAEELPAPSADRRWLAIVAQPHHGDGQVEVYRARRARARLRSIRLWPSRMRSSATTGAASSATNTLGAAAQPRRNADSLILIVATSCGSEAINNRRDDDNNRRSAHVEKPVKVVDWTRSEN